MHLQFTEKWRILSLRLETVNRFVRLWSCYYRIGASKFSESVYGVRKTNNSGSIWGKDEVTLASNHLLLSAFSEPLLGFYGHLSTRLPAVRVQTPNRPNPTFKTHTHIHTHTHKHTHCSVIRAESAISSWKDAHTFCSTVSSLLLFPHNLRTRCLDWLKIEKWEIYDLNERWIPMCKPDSSRRGRAQKQRGEKPQIGATEECDLPVLLSLL